MPHWVHSLLHWLSLHWGDVVPAWLAVIVAAVFGFCRGVRRVGRRRPVMRRGLPRLRPRPRLNAPTGKAAEEAAAAAGQAVVELRRSAAAQETHTALLQDQADAAERFPWDIRHLGD